MASKRALMHIAFNSGGLCLISVNVGEAWSLRGAMLVVGVDQPWSPHCHRAKVTFPRSRLARRCDGPARLRRVRAIHEVFASEEAREVIFIRREAIEL